MKEYWFCVIGPCERKALPHGADFPLRQAVQTEYEALTGSVNYRCSSGWGVSEDAALAIFLARENPKKVLELFKEKE